MVLNGTLVTHQPVHNTLLCKVVCCHVIPGSDPEIGLACENLLSGGWLEDFPMQKYVKVLCARDKRCRRKGSVRTYRPFLSSIVSCDGLRHAEFSSVSIVTADEIGKVQNEPHEDLAYNG